MPGNDIGEFRLSTSGLLPGVNSPWSPSRYLLGGPQLQLKISPD
jgi:hypothetical protein